MHPIILDSSATDLLSSQHLQWFHSTILYMVASFKLTNSHDSLIHYVIVVFEYCNYGLCSQNAPQTLEECL
jgi:hypothetical protein